MYLILLFAFFTTSGCLIKVRQAQTGQHKRVVIDRNPELKEEGKNWVENTLFNYHKLVGNNKVFAFVIKTLSYHPNKVHPVMRKYREYTGNAINDPHDLHSGFYEVGLRQEKNDVLYEDVSSKSRNYIRVRFTLTALRYLNARDICMSDTADASSARFERTQDALTLHLRKVGKNPGKDITFVTSMAASKTPIGEIYFYMGRDNKLKTVSSGFRINRDPKTRKITATLHIQTFITINHDCTQVVEDLTYVKEF